MGLRVRIFFGIFFAISLFSAFSESVRLSVEPIFSYSNGVLNEAIYHSTSPSKKISFLEWERKIWMYGLRVDGGYKNFRLNIAVENSIPEKSGEMRDSDWLNTADYSMKTTYSVGPNNADKNFDSTLSLSYDFEIVRGFSISPVVQAQYSFDSFYRKKGDSRGWYGQSDNSSDGKNHWWYEDEAENFPYTYWNEEKGRYVTRKLAGIDYYRHSLYFWAGFNLSFRINKFLFQTNFLLNAYSYFSSEDRHHTAGDDKVFHAIQDSFFSCSKIGLGVTYDFTKRISFGLDAEFLAVPETKGDLYEGWSKNLFQSSGISGNSFAVTSGIKIILL